MVNKENITKFLIGKFYIIIAFSALVLAVLMVLQIAFISQNVDISECLAYAEIFEESSDDLVESVDSLDEGAVKSSYGNVSSVFSQRAEEYKSMAI